MSYCENTSLLGLHMKNKFCVRKVLQYGLVSLVRNPSRLFPSMGYFFLSSVVVCFFLCSLTRSASFKASSELRLTSSSKCHMSFSLSSPHHFVHVFCANKNGVYDPNRNIARLTSGNAYHFFPTFILLFICHFNKFCGFIFRSKTKPASLRTSNFLVITETLDRRPIAASHMIL